MLLTAWYDDQINTTIQHEIVVATMICSSIPGGARDINLTSWCASLTQVSPHHFLVAPWRKSCGLVSPPVRRQGAHYASRLVVIRTPPGAKPYRLAPVVCGKGIPPICAGLGGAAVVVATFPFHIQSTFVLLLAVSLLGVFSGIAFGSS